MRVTDSNLIVTPRIATAFDDSTPGELTLGEVAEIVHGLRAVPRLDDVRRWFSALLLRQRDYDAYRLFDERRYARNLIARGAYAELLMLCWRSGQRTPIHDHGGSIGVVMVAEGCLSETMYERTEDGRVRPYNTNRWSPGAITGADIPDIHCLLNLAPEGRDLVTLHCYAPPLSVLNTFSPRSPRVRRWREGYFSAGAGI